MCADLERKHREVCEVREAEMSDLFRETKGYLFVGQPPSVRLHNTRYPFV